MFVLAFDTATATGIAFGRAGETPSARTMLLSGDWPRRYSTLMKATRAVIEEFNPDIVAVESPVQGPKANPNLVGLAACVMGEADRRGSKVVAYFPATIRKHFLGGIRSKQPIKTQVYNKCRLLGWEPKDTDQSDAMALWSYVCALHDPRHGLTDVGGLFAKVVL